MRGKNICDTCGELMTDETTSVVLVQVAASIAPKGQKTAVLTHVGVLEGREPKLERFEVCVTCALALMVGLKHAKKQVMRHGRVVRV